MKSTENEEPRFITALSLAAYRIGKPEDDPAGWSGEDFDRARVSMLGGCEVCHATIAAYNAYPSRSGYWRCEDCIGSDGFETVEDAAREIFGDGEPQKVVLRKDDLTAYALRIGIWESLTKGMPGGMSAEEITIIRSEGGES